MTVEEKIGILVDRYCRNRSHLADMIEVSPQAVNNWVYRDHIPNRGIEAIIAHFPQIDRNWLRGGSTLSSSGPLPLPEEDEEEENDTQHFKTTQDAGLKTAEHHVEKTPQNRNSAILASELYSSTDDIPQPDNREGLVPIQMPRRDIKYVFLCHGDSMLPRIQDGDYVGVGEALGRYEDFRKEDLYLIQTTDGRLMVKMVEDPGPTLPYLLLSTENTTYQMADGGRFPKNEVHAVYRVIMVMRDI